MFLLDFLYPKSCLGCGREGSYICNICLKSTHASTLICPFCKRFSPEGRTHTQCVHKTPLSGVYSFWKYEGIIKKAITQTKYRFLFDITNDLALSVRKEWSRVPKVFDNAVFVPIPSNSSRLRWRGFNQSEKVLHSLAKRLELTYNFELLVKNSSSPPQVTLPKQLRLRNLRGKFAVNTKAIGGYKGKIVIFDDVYTTGTTLEEAARVLRAAGFTHVWGMTIARS